MSDIQASDTLREWTESAPYWEKYSATIRTMFAPVTRALIEDAGITKGQSVLDVAGGAELKQLYGEMKEPWGGVDNILKIQSLNPASLRGHFEFYTALMRGPSGLSRVQREMIAVVVSAANHCHY